MKRRRKPGPRKPRPKPAARPNSKSRPRGGRPTDSSENARLRGELQAANAALAAARNEIREGGEQQTALAEILRAISTSPGNLGPVLDSLVASAARFCGAEDASIFQIDGDMLRLAAHHGQVPGSGVDVRIPIVRGTVGGRSVLERRPVHVADVPSETDEFPEGSEISRRVGHRTILSVPLLVRDVPVGVIQLRRAEVRPFTRKQIELLEMFADQAVIAIENVRLFTELQANNAALTLAHAQVTETLEQQTATAEILRVISQSPTDVQPVFDAIVASAVRLCAAQVSSAFHFDGELMHLVAHHNYPPEALAIIRAMHPRRPHHDQASGRAVLTRAVVQIEDTLADSEYRTDMARHWRSVIAVPMLRGGEPIGAITVVRSQPGVFPPGQTDLLKTFADQAVIAIENVRLFTELATSNRELTTALDTQTATSDILRVISSALTDIQPVLDAVAQNSARLCEASDAVIQLREPDNHLRLAAHFGEIPAPLGMRRPLTRGWVAGRSVLEAQQIHLEDLQAEEAEYPQGTAIARTAGHRTILTMPLVREGEAIGVIQVRRMEVRPFSEKHISLLHTFADQAVIALENVRLFTELQTSNRELTAALDTQTATSEILRVISRSQTDVQPVFDAIMESARRLLHADSGSLTRVTDGHLGLAAYALNTGVGEATLRAAFPISLDSDSSHALALRGRAPLNMADAETDPRTTDKGREIARARGYRSMVVVPMLRHDEPIGTISLTRRAPGGFSNDEISLLQTFADQAVIAIENARLFTELQTRTEELTRSVAQLTALGEVGRAVSSSLDLDTVLSTIVARAVQLSGTDGGTIFEYDETAEEFSARATWNASENQSATLRGIRLRRGEGAVGQMAVTREPFQIPDIAAEGAYASRIRSAMLESGTRSVLAVPLLHEERIVGGLVVTRRVSGEFSPAVIEILRTFAIQSALAIQNARLFSQLEIKSRELEVASRHKSEFLASMSHELRTPLNAIIGFSDVLLQGMFGETNEKQEEYLRDILSSGQHLLSLINDILDLSKIEAGRMDLELTDFHMPAAIDDAMMLMRERAARRGQVLDRAIEPALGHVRADERKFKQVVLNLLSNAVKFTPDGGRITVSAGVANGEAIVSVTDTGIGIAPEHQDLVFEEFRQVGHADKKAEGTGLGLALCRKFIELHGGRIALRSELGKGSTFTFALPLAGPPRAD